MSGPSPSGTTVVGIELQKAKYVHSYDDVEHYTP